MKNWGLDQIGFTVVPTLIFDMTKAKARYVMGSTLSTRTSVSQTRVFVKFWRENLCLIHNKKPTCLKAFPLKLWWLAQKKNFNLLAFCSNEWELLQRLLHFRWESKYFGWMPDKFFDHLLNQIWQFIFDLDHLFGYIICSLSILIYFVRKCVKLKNSDFGPLIKDFNDINLSFIFPYSWLLLYCMYTI